MKKESNTAHVRQHNVIYASVHDLHGYEIGAVGDFISLAKDTPVFKNGELSHWLHRKETRMVIHETPNANGELSYNVRPTISGKQRRLSIARLVLMAHAPVPNVNTKKCYAWAIDRDSSNADISNLRWVLKSDTYFKTNEAGNRVLTLKPDAILH